MRYLYASHIQVNVRTRLETKKTTALHDLVKEASPGGPSGNLGAVSVDLLPVVLTSASVNIDLVNRQPTLTLPEVANSPEGKDNGESQV